MTTLAIKPVSIRMNNELHERLEKIAALKKRSVHWLMKDALEQYVGDQEEEIAFMQACEDSFQEYAETGLHATKEETLDWIDRWGTEKGCESLRCHQ